MTAADLAELDSLSAQLTAADIEAARVRRDFYAKVRALYDAGVPPSQIAEAAHITRQRVNQLVNRRAR